MNCKHGCGAPLEVVCFDDEALTAVVRCSHCLSICGKLSAAIDCPCCSYPHCGHDHAKLNSEPAEGKEK
jgi:hypothetical protein